MDDSTAPKSTPGPWRVGNILKMFSGTQAREIDSENALIGLVYGVHDDDNAANAVLIAAAPELAEALREMYDLEDTDGHRLDGDRSLRAMSRAAILLERVGY